MRRGVSEFVRSGGGRRRLGCCRRRVFGGGLVQVQDRAAQPIQTSDRELVALAQQLEYQVQPGPGRLRAGGVIDVNVLYGDPGPDQRVGLVVGVLVGASCRRFPPGRMLWLWV